MEFNRITKSHPEHNCTRYNQMQLRLVATRNNSPIASFTANHAGEKSDTAHKLDAERFHGLSNLMELTNGARVIITHNLSVEHGLLNGTQGTVVAIIYYGDKHPRAETPVKSNARPHHRRLSSIPWASVLERSLVR